MNKSKLCFLLVVYLLSAEAVNIRSQQPSLSKGAEESEPQLHRITLKKVELSSDQKRRSMELLTTAQGYSYDRKQYSKDKDFILAQKETQDVYHSSAMPHTVKMFNFKNVQYTGEISFGQQGNTFNVIYDTGSANIWINSKHCKDEGCLNHKQYDSQNSKTFKKGGLNLDVQFGTGELLGQFSQETIYFGDVKVENQDFVEIFEERGNVFAEAHFDGIVGLAFPSMAAFNKNPLFDNLMQQKRVPNNIFAFYMSPREGNSNSEITIGGADRNRYSGEIKYHKVLKDYYWLVGADNILVGGKDVGLCTGGCYVVADTGTSLITGPSDSIFSLLDQTNVDSFCNNVSSLPDITFVLDGVNYTLTGEEYVLKQQNGEQQTVQSAKANLEMSSNSGATCAPAFMPLDIPNDEANFPYEKAWILGDTFLSKFYSVYDRDRGMVGFGLAKH